VGDLNAPRAAGDRIVRMRDGRVVTDVCAWRATIATP